MCLIALWYRVLPDAPLVMAANREEDYLRPTLFPELREGRPTVLCGLDGLSGGTWLAVNEQRLVAAVTNRRKAVLPANPRSRGLLCLDLARCPSARHAAGAAWEALHEPVYAGANLLLFDPHSAWVIHAGDRVERIELEPGLHFIANGDLNDPHDPRLRLARELSLAEWSAQANGREAGSAWVRSARTVCSQYCAEPGRPSVIVRGPTRGTVSSTILSLTGDPARAEYHYSDGSPDQAAYRDLSHLLRRLLASGHSPEG